MNSSDPANAQRINQILWGTILTTQVVYVVLLATGLVTRAESVDVPFLPAVFAVVSLTTGVGAQWCFRRATGAGLSAHLPRPDPARSFPFYIFAWALDESIAIYGLVLGFLGFPVGVWVGFSLAAFVLTLLHRPST